MKKIHQLLSLAVTATIFLASCGEKKTSDKALNSDSIVTLAAEAYKYTYPLWTEYRSRYKSTSDPTSKFYAPLNTIHFTHKLVEAKDSFPLGPNNDTPYFFGHLDLSKGPLVIHVPEHGSRYYSVLFWDSYGSNQYIGTRTTGNKEGRFLLAGPDWNGKVPEGLKLIRFEDNFLSLLGRTLVYGKNDLTNVIKLQDATLLTPLSDYPAEEGKYKGTSRAFAPFHAEPDSFFVVVNQVLSLSPPVKKDSVLLKSFAAIGIGAGKQWNWKAFDASTREKIKARLKEVDQELLTRANTYNVTTKNKWLRSTPLLGRYGDDYQLRAAAARAGFFGGNNEEESIYYTAFVDADGDTLSGANKYTLHFNKGQLPAVKGFWSLTLYSAKGWYLVDNPIQRYSFGSRHPEYKTNVDGSVDLYIQAESPGKDKESNWLPSGNNPFILLGRAYIPEPALLHGDYNLPEVVHVKSEKSLTSIH